MGKLFHIWSNYRCVLNLFCKHEDIFASSITSKRIGNWNLPSRKKILHSQYHGCWYPGNTRSQSHSIYMIIPKYYSWAPYRGNYANKPCVESILMMKFLLRWIIKNGNWQTIQDNRRRLDHNCFTTESLNAELAMDACDINKYKSTDIDGLTDHQSVH